MGNHAQEFQYASGGAGDSPFWCCGLSVAILHSRAPAVNRESFRMVASMYVAPKERIALVDVLGEKLLIGITAQQISFLARIEDDKDLCDSQKAEAPGGFFKTLLRRKTADGFGEHRSKGRWELMPEVRKR